MKQITSYTKHSSTAQHCFLSLSLSPPIYLSRSLSLSLFSSDVLALDHKLPLPLRLLVRRLFLQTHRLQALPLLLRLRLLPLPRLIESCVVEEIVGELVEINLLTGRGREGDGGDKGGDER